MPLWMTAMSPWPSRCGWALSCVGLPCVAPARVPQRRATVRDVTLDAAAQHQELADVLDDAQPAFAVEDGETGAIVAAVLQLREAVQDDRRRFLRPSIGSDPHMSPFGSHDAPRARGPCGTDGATAQPNGGRGLSVRAAKVLP